MSTLDAWNLDLLGWFAAKSAPAPRLDALAVFFARAGPCLLLLGLVAGWLWGHRRRLDLLEAGEAGLLGLAVNQGIAWFTFYRRPYMLGLVRPLVTHAYETSFPSDHATLLFTVGIYLLWAARRRWTGAGGLLLGLLTSWGRVYGGLHFPLDIVGSGAVAFGAAVAVGGTRCRLVPLNQRILDVYAQIFAGPIHRGWVRDPGFDPE